MRVVIRASSSISTSTIRLAPWRAHWRQSSEPIEPPAPVTSTLRPPSQSRIAFQSGTTGSAAKQILDRDFLQLAGHGAAFEDVVEPRHHAERQAGGFAGFDDAAHALRIERRHGDHQQLGGGFGRDARHVVDPPEHRHAMQVRAAQPGGIVEETDRLVGAGAQQVADQRVTGAAGAEDQHAHGGLVAVDEAVVLPRAVEQPGAHRASRSAPADT